MSSVYLVGGAVRDALLDNLVKERDWVVVGATPQEMLAQGYKQVGKDFPVFLHPETGEEYALARTERKQGKGYTGFECYAAPDVTLEQDLERRDLTINAIAQAADGTIIDPFGGQRDLQNRILRHVSPAFVEDPLRVLRIARFYARYAHLGFRVADETLVLLKQMAKEGDLDALVPERVWQELQRALTEKTPHYFFLLLRECDALSILFPEVDQLFGIPNPPQWHPEIDSGVHTMMVIEQAAKLTRNTLVRFAAMLHDLGKAVTPPEKWPKHHNHGELGIPLVKQFCDRLRVPRDYAELAILVSRYHIECHQALELRAVTLLKLLEKLDAFRRPQRFRLFLLACESDARGRTGFENKPYFQSRYLQEIFRIAAQVPVQPILEQGFKNAEVAEELRKRRLQFIAANFKALKSVYL